MKAFSKALVQRQRLCFHFFKFGPVITKCYSQKISVTENYGFKNIQ